LFNIGTTFRIKNLAVGMPRDIKVGYQLKVIDAHDECDGLVPSLYKVKVKNKSYIVPYDVLEFVIGK
jgi:hypothetical protein